MPVDLILQRLNKVRKNGANKWMACCPAHEDRSPSLAIAEQGDKILLHCFAGCEVPDILTAIDLSIGDLFADRNFYRETPDKVAREGRRLLQKQEDESIRDDIVLDWYMAELKDGKKFSQEEHDKYRELFLKIKKQKEAA